MWNSRAFGGIQVRISEIKWNFYDFSSQKGPVKSPPSQNVAVALRFLQKAYRKLPSTGRHLR